MKLRPKIILLAIFILVIVMAGIAVPIYWYTRSALEQEIDRRLLNVTSIASHTLDSNLVAILLQEPAMNSVKQRLESQLQYYMTNGMLGLLIIDSDQRILANVGDVAMVKSFIRQDFIQSSVSPTSVDPFISDIYEFQDNQSIKLAVLPLLAQENNRAYLVIIGDINVLPFMEELYGLLFYIFLGTFLLVLTLTFIFSQSLIKPLLALVNYANSLKRSINTEPISMQRKDEIGDLHVALREMHDEIRENEQKNKELLASIAHEIKNPLGGIEIYTGLLKEEMDEENKKLQYLEKIRESMEDLDQVVTSYLDLARPPRSETKELRVDEIIEDIEQILQPELQSKNISLFLEGKARIDADESKLRRVFLNIIRNSIQAISTKDGVIKVSITELAQKIRIEIADNGTGIPQDKINNIFEPFYTTKTKGHGLGLAIARNIIQEMDGSIFVESKDGNGTTFTITLPID